MGAASYFVCGIWYFQFCCYINKHVFIKKVWCHSKLMWVVSSLSDMFAVFLVFYICNICTV